MVDVLQDGDTALLLAVAKDNADEAVPVVEALLECTTIDVTLTNKVDVHKWLGLFEVLDGHGTYDRCVAGWQHCTVLCYH